jgi:hypothetical protein
MMIMLKPSTWTYMLSQYRFHPTPQARFSIVHMRHTTVKVKIGIVPMTKTCLLASTCNRAL